MHLGLITARGGSKSIPGKNLADLGGRPMIDWTFASAKDSQLDRVIVSTDDRRIAEHASSCGIEVLERPAELASDRAESIDVAIHAVTTLRLTMTDTVTLLQPTSPFRSATDIDDAISATANGWFDSAIGVSSVGHYHPNRMLILAEGRLVSLHSETNEHTPRQALESVFVRNGAIYHASSKLILERRFRGDRCAAIVMPESRSLNIDSAFDLMLARLLATNPESFLSV